MDDLMETKMMIRLIRMRLIVVFKTKGETIPIIFMIRTIEIRDQEEEGKDMKEEVFVENVFTVKKRGIENLNVLNTKEGLIEEYKAKLELHMSMKMPNHHILKMLKEEKP